ncbi:MAG: glycosyltransferase [Burkholderiales bacterium]|nr:glycosyltransferase [Burkholderiales bacterium]
MDSPKVSFIIPVLHLKRPVNPSRFFMPRYTVKEVLDDLERNVALPREVIVVCNSRDPDLLKLVTKHPRVDKYCLNSVNVGVARAWNMGAQMAEGEALCFVNDDVAVGAGSMEALFEVLAQDDVGQVGPRGAKWVNGTHDRFVGEASIEEADAISGFLFMIKDAVFRQVGGFDVFYSPAGFEEIDMSFAIRKAGKKCLVVPGLSIQHHHHHGVSAYRSEIKYLSKSIDTQTLHERNRAYFMKKWAGASAG